jgi:hypothetical protein
VIIPVINIYYLPSEIRYSGQRDYETIPCAAMRRSTKNLFLERPTRVQAMRWSNFGAPLKLLIASEALVGRRWPGRQPRLSDSSAAGVSFAPGELAANLTHLVNSVVVALAWAGTSDL